LKLKLLLVVGNCSLNGTEKYAIELASNLNKEKYSVVIATPERGQLSDIMNKYGIREFVYNNGKMNKFSLKGTLNLLKHIKEEKYDIVHANNGIIPCILSKLIGIKIVVETKHGLFFTEEKLRKLNFFTFIHEHLKQYYSDYIIAISQKDKSYLIKYFKFKEHKIKVIYNGIKTDNLDKYKDLKLRVDKNENENFILGNIGRLTYQKAQERIIKASTVIGKEIEGLKILLIGEGENRDMLTDMIKKNKLEDIVSILSYKENIYDYYMEMDALILTSRFEGIPFVLMESMALGIPVITTDVGGIGDIIKNGFNGIIIDGDNINEIKEAIKKLKYDKITYKKIQMNALETISKYSIKSFINNYEDVYSSALN